MISQRQVVWYQEEIKGLNAELARRESDLKVYKDECARFMAERDHWRGLAERRQNEIDRLKARTEEVDKP